MGSSEKSEPQYEVVWPLGRKVFFEAAPAERVRDFSGKTIAAIWDHLFRGDEIFSLVTQKLAERFPGMKIVTHHVFGNTHGPLQRELVAKIPEKLAQHKVDAVISSVGA